MAYFLQSAGALLDGTDPKSECEYQQLPYDISFEDPFANHHVHQSLQYGPCMFMFTF